LLCLANQLTPILSPLQRPDSLAQDLPPEANDLLAEIVEQSSDAMGAMTSALRY
jgi:hypothetical protein